MRFRWFNTPAWWSKNENLYSKHSFSSIWYILLFDRDLDAAVSRISRCSRIITHTCISSFSSCILMITLLWHFCKNMCFVSQIHVSLHVSVILSYFARYLSWLFYCTFISGNMFFSYFYMLFQHFIIYFLLFDRNLDVAVSSISRFCTNYHTKYVFLHVCFVNFHDHPSAALPWNMCFVQKIHVFRHVSVMLSYFARYLSWLL